MLVRLAVRCLAPLLALETNKLEVLYDDDGLAALAEAGAIARFPQ